MKNSWLERREERDRLYFKKLLFAPLDFNEVWQKLQLNVSENFKAIQKKTEKFGWDINEEIKPLQTADGKWIIVEEK